MPQGPPVPDSRPTLHWARCRGMRLVVLDFLRPPAPGMARESQKVFIRSLHRLPPSAASICLEDGLSFSHLDCTSAAWTATAGKRTHHVLDPSGGD